MGRWNNWIRFDRNELSGSFGDIGTDLPLLLAMIPVAGLDPTSVFVLFGVAQIATGLVYGLPMPMQPLKAMAALVITHRLSGEVLFGGGLAIGLVMLALTVSGALNLLATLIPRSVMRGIQMGLGLTLASIALGRYVPSTGVEGYVLAAAAFGMIVALWNNRRWPAALPVIGLGLVWALFVRVDVGAVTAGVGLMFPGFHVPTVTDIWTGFLVLALPQLPLSLANSVIATRQTLHDLYPNRNVSIFKIGLSYSVANLVMPFFGGVPVCHGCGGLAGHYAFGGRTGGSVVLYGSFYLLLGLFAGRVIGHVVEIFPLPILGVVLLFEALVLMRFVSDVAGSRRDLTIALLVAVVAFSIPQGFVVGLVVGSITAFVCRRFDLLGDGHR